MKWIQIFKILQKKISIALTEERKYETFGFENSRKMNEIFQLKRKIDLIIASWLQQIKITGVRVRQGFLAPKYEASDCKIFLIHFLEFPC